MEFLTYSVLFAFLYLYLGLGLTLLLCTGRMKRYTLFLSPLLGFCYATLAGWSLYSLDLRGTDAYAPVLLFIPGGLLLLCIVRSSGWPKGILDLKLAAALGVGVAAFLILSFPVAANAEGLTAISKGNNDIGLYAIFARYFKEFARTDPVSMLDQFQGPYFLRFAFGACFSTALPSSLLNIEPFKLQNVSLNVFFLFSVLLSYAVAVEVFRYSHFSALGISALYGLSPLMCYTTYHGFAAQIIATALNLGILLLHAQVIESCNGISDYLRYVPVALLLNWGVLVTYAHMFPLIYLAVALYAVSMRAPIHGRRSVSRWALWCLTTLLLALSLSPSRLLDLPGLTILRATSNSGWTTRLMTPDVLVGLSPDLNLPPETWLLGFVISVLVLGVVGAGLARVAKEDRSQFTYACLFLFFIVVCYVALVSRDAGTEWEGYRGFKLISFFLPNILPALLLLFRGLGSASNWRLHRQGLFLLSAFLIGNLICCYGALKSVIDHHKAVTRDVQELRTLEANQTVGSINISGRDWWEVLWMTHFLIRKKLYFEPTAYFVSAKLEGEWDLKRTKEGGEILQLRPLDPAETIYVNSSYMLERAGERILTAYFDRGWYEAEATHRWTGGDSDVSTVILESAADNLSVSLSAKYWPLDRTNHLFVYLNGGEVAKCLSNESCEVAGLRLSRGTNTLEFRTTLPPRRPNNGDRRRLGYAFTSLEIAPSRIPSTAVPTAPA